MKAMLLMLALLFLVACGGGSGTDKGDQTADQSAVDTNQGVDTNADTNPGADTNGADQVGKPDTKLIEDNQGGEDGAADSQGKNDAEADSTGQPDNATPPDLVSQPDIVTSPGSITAVWANNGQDKVVQSDLRATNKPDSVKNSVWDGSAVKLFGAKNEVVAFNLVLEAGTGAVSNVSVEFTSLVGTNAQIVSKPAADNNSLFNWIGRPIELFYVRYLQIKGLSNLAYEWYYDERHVPKRLRRPWTGDGVGSGTWNDRPDANKFYPDIAVPLELHPTFEIKAKQNQSIWIDVFIPKSLPAGIYNGTVVVKEDGKATHAIPVQLKVYDFSLPDKPNGKTMLVLGYSDINRRYMGKDWFDNQQDEKTATKIRDRHFLIAHRHRISLVGGLSSSTEMLPHWVPRLDGTLFTAKNGYDGPGIGVGNGIYSVGLYGGWQNSWNPDSQSDMHTKSDYWVNWFKQNSPDTLYFLYLTDEPGSDGYAEVENWAKWMDANTGPGKDLMSFSTVSYGSGRKFMPSLDIPCMWTTFGPTLKFQEDFDAIENDSTKLTCMYNGNRPASGSFATEDDGVALRVLAWTQYKFGIDFWFFWESTYYNDFQATGKQTDLFNEARTFGTKTENDPIGGEQGWNYTNGDGVLFYPGTDTVFPKSSYGINGPIVSLRLKHWRRGIQDIDYLTMAMKKDPEAVKKIVAEMVPKVLWEYGVNDPNDPTWVKTEISWSINPDDWEKARLQLAEIIAK